VQATKIICALTWWAAGDNGIESWHWYAIIGHRGGHGCGEVELFNPWGRNTSKYTVVTNPNQLTGPRTVTSIRGGGNANFWMTIHEFGQIFHQITYEDWFALNQE
jgi:hypothetical protein